jgi:hypothetical protein
MSVVVKLLALRPPCARKPPLPDSHTRLYTIGAESPQPYLDSHVDRRFSLLYPQAFKMPGLSKHDEHVWRASGCSQAAQNAPLLRIHPGLQ